MKKHKIPKYLQKINLDAEAVLDKANRGRKLSCLVSCTNFMQWCKNRSSECFIRSDEPDGALGAKRDIRGNRLLSQSNKLWCNGTTSTQLCVTESVRNGVKVQRVDHEEHQNMADGIACGMSDAISKGDKTRVTSKVKTAVDSWISQHPKLCNVVKTHNNHRCTAKRCKDYFVNLVIKEWLSKNGKDTHVCVTDNKAEAVSCSMKHDPDAHHHQLGVEDRMYVCTRYGDLHWCVDQCEFMTRELKTTIAYCPISGRTLVADVELRTIGDDITESQGRGVGACELVRAVAVASIQHKDEVSWMNVNDLKSGWIRGLVNCKTIKEIEDVRMDTIPRVGRHPVSTYWVSMACDVWSLLCQERHDIQDWSVDDRIRLAKISGVRDVNRRAAEHRIRLAKQETRVPYCTISTIEVITKFYSIVRPRIKMAPLAEADASEYVSKLTDRLVHLWQVIMGECEKRGMEFASDMSTFAIGSLYILANGIIIPATTAFEAERVLLEPDNPLKDMLPSYDVTHALTHIPQKSITVVMNKVRSIVMEMSEHDPRFVSRLNDVNAFQRLE